MCVRERGRQKKEEEILGASINFTCRAGPYLSARAPIICAYVRRAAKEGVLRWGESVCERERERVEDAGARGKVYKER